MTINDIVIIGAGHVANNLASAFKRIGKKIICIYSRDLNKTVKLAKMLDASYTNQLNEIPPKADLYLLAVTDKAIKEVAEELRFVSGIVAHTSGSVNISVFEKTNSDFGVFYPLMHFSSENVVDFSEIPLCIEANNELCQKALNELANAISRQVHIVSSSDRKILHLSAIFASNFTNLNYIIAEEILKKHGLSFNMLRPIIIETANKILKEKPSKLQTGPAIREDNEVIDEHIQLLNDFPQYQKIYELLTEIIIQKKKSNEL